MKRQQQAGMTLIELVIVIIVLGIIAAVAAPKFADISGNAATAALAGSQDGVKSGFTIAMGAAATPGAPDYTEITPRIDGLTWAAGVGTTPDWDKDAATEPDLTVYLYAESNCTTQVTATGTPVLGYAYDINNALGSAAAATCQTN